MPEYRRIVRAFLASPGDLNEERRAVKDAVQEVNDTWSDKFGYYVELMGWEETLPKFGRPQATINQELDRCDLFIGLLWKKWGTPPDQNGPYTSGFEEEFERALANRQQAGKPEMALYFKYIEEEFLADPGVDLTRVLDFKRRLTKKKYLFFQEFSDKSELQMLIRKCVSSFITKVSDNEIDSDRASEESIRVVNDTEGNLDGQDSSSDSPLSNSGYGFLTELVAKLRSVEGLEQVTSRDIARLRLLANSISKSGNDDPEFGAHDLNILYAQKDDLTLGRLEDQNLAKQGLEKLQSENVPFWHWYTKTDGRDFLLVESMIAMSDDEKIGAIKVLDYLGIKLPFTDGLGRDYVLKWWFEKNQSAAVRNAAIEYLATCGTDDDLSFVEAEYERNDSRTARKALEAMIAITHRTSGNEASAKIAIGKQFGTLSQKILAPTLKGFGDLEDEVLRNGTTHRNEQVRLRCLEILHKKNQITEPELERLLNDDDPEIRNRALRVLVEQGRLFSNEDVKNALVRTSQHQGLLGRALGTQREGEQHFEAYEHSQLIQLKRRELKRMVDEALVHNDASYFALTDRYFSVYADRLRSDIDDQFKSYFDERVQRFARLISEKMNTDTIRQTLEIGDFLRKRLIRRGLNILGAKKQPEDLDRIRGVLHAELLGASATDLAFLGRFGGWEDIEIASKAKPTSSVLEPSSVLGTDDFEALVVSTVYKLGREDVSRLVSVSMPSGILAKVLAVCTDRVFSNISDDALFDLLMRDSAEVRKAACLCVARAFSATRASVILERYLATEHRYYNVVHWLDLAVSLPRRVVRQVTAKASD